MIRTSIVTAFMKRLTTNFVVFHSTLHLAHLSSLYMIKLRLLSPSHRHSCTRTTTLSFLHQHTHTHTHSHTPVFSAFISRRPFLSFLLFSLLLFFSSFPFVNDSCFIPLASLYSEHMCVWCNICFRTPMYRS